MFQAGPTVVDDLTHHDTPHRIDILSGMHNVVRPPILHVTIDDGTIRVALSKRANLRFEVGDVCFGPFDLDPMAGRLRHGA